MANHQPEYQNENTSFRASLQTTYDMQYGLEISLYYYEPLKFWTCLSLQQKLKNTIWLFFHMCMIYFDNKTFLKTSEDMEIF